MPSARYTREIPQRYRLEAGKCSACGTVYYPPRRVCVCGGRDFETATLPMDGKLVTYTIIRVGPSDFAEEVPYALGIVEVEGGVRLMAQIVDVPLEDVKTGMPLRLEFRKISEEGEAGIICYGHKAVPA
ncbi:MAG: Zn-ribbon domain-containing OB-fold protein [Candidatus Zixiibacteriota bacterium]|jgi:uncharacterized OB-fold protein